MGEIANPCRTEGLFLYTVQTLGLGPVQVMGVGEGKAGGIYLGRRLAA